MGIQRVLTNLKGAFSPNPTVAWGFDFIPDAAIVLDGSRILWLGRRVDLPATWIDSDIIDGSGRWASPGFVDPHTHLLFGGDRSGEFNRRLHGVSYAQIASDGGGIRETVRATRIATLSELIDIGEVRLNKFRRKGVVHLEAKTGYGLELETESRLLEAYSRLKRRGWSLDVTLMPAHDIPPEFNGITESYIETVAKQWQPELVRRHPGIARFCDVFVEKGVFTANQGREILQSGKALGLRSRVHADEFCSTGGAELAAELGAASADHLMFATDRGIADMARAGVIPTLLPATTLFLGMQHFAPARRMIEAGCLVALASDFNPGSCACIDPLLVLRLACLQLRMTFEESFTAMTLHAAASLGRSELGHLHPGGSSEILLWDIKHPLDLVYWMGENFLPNYVGHGQ
jgi:imidazolonepropionase